MRNLHTKELQITHAKFHDFFKIYLQFKVPYCGTVFSIIEYPIGNLKRNLGED
jgi:hypothetical protein